MPTPTPTELALGFGAFASCLILVRPPIIKSYVSKQGAKRILRYQYSGADLSYIYRYFSSPLAAALVEYVPWWVAPNTITVSGLGLIILSHLAMAWHCPNFDGEAPAEEIACIVGGRREMLSGTSASTPIFAGVVSPLCNSV